jgi:hypothetical protein
MGATNLLVIGSGVNAASIDDALLQHNLSVDNFIVYGHFGVHRVITLYATKNKLGFIRVTQKTCMDRATALLVISSGPLSPENRRIIGWAHAKGIPVVEHDTSRPCSLSRLNLESEESFEESSDDSDEDSSSDAPLRGSLSSGELSDLQGLGVPNSSPTASVYSTHSVRAPPPIARYDSDVERSKEAAKSETKSVAPEASEIEASHNSDSGSESDSE